MSFRDVQFGQHAPEWPVALRVDTDSTAAATAAGDSRQKSPKRGRKSSTDDHVLLLHGHLACSALCLRYPLDLAPALERRAAAESTSSDGRASHGLVGEGAPVPGSAQVWKSRQHVAMVCMADKSMLFERVLAVHHSSSTSSTGSTSSISDLSVSDASPPSNTTADIGSAGRPQQYSYDSNSYPTVRAMLCSMKNRLGQQRAIRFRASAAARSSDGSHRHESEYILCARSCGAGSLPWKDIAEDADTKTVPAFKLIAQYGRVYLENVTLTLDEHLGLVQLCVNVSYQNAHELAVMVTTLVQHAMGSTLRLRVFNVAQNISLPVLQEFDASNDADERDGHQQFLSVDVFDVRSKAFVLASMNEHCILMSRDVALPVVPIDLGSDLTDQYSRASRALARVLLQNPDLLVKSTEVFVCECSVKKQLDGKCPVTLSPLQTTCSVQSLPLSAYSSNAVVAPLRRGRSLPEVVGGSRANSLPILASPVLEGEDCDSEDELPLLRSSEALAKAEDATEAVSRLHVAQSSLPLLPPKTRSRSPSPCRPHTHRLQSLPTSLPGHIGAGTEQSVVKGGHCHAPSIPERPVCTLGESDEDCPYIEPNQAMNPGGTSGPFSDSSRPYACIADHTDGPPPSTTTTSSKHNHSSASQSKNHQYARIAGESSPPEIPPKVPPPLVPRSPRPGSTGPARTFAFSVLSDEHSSRPRSAPCTPPLPKKEKSTRRSKAPEAAKGDGSLQGQEYLVLI